MKTQIGISATADFEENTWTFEMTESLMSVAAGKFAIVDLKDYENALQKIQLAKEAIGNNAEFAFLKDDLEAIFKLL